MSRFREIVGLEARLAYGEELKGVEGVEYSWLFSKKACCERLEKVR